MRIGFDMFAVQSPHHANRGIGRHARGLVRAMLDRDDGNEFFLYAHAGFTEHPILHSPKATLRVLGRETESDRVSISQAIERLSRDNPDSLDVLIVLSAFEPWGHYLPPGPHPGGPRLAAVVHDMIPFLSPAEFQAQHGLRRFYRALEQLRRYDALFAISGATRVDVLRLMGLPEPQVVNISSADDPGLFSPAPGPLSEPDRRRLRRLGVIRPFVLNVGGMDERKNRRGLIEAFSMLPDALRHTHQLVLAFSNLPPEVQRLCEYAEERGVGEAVVITGEADDEQLRVLYQRCEAFAFPSLYEGFGLPLLEAMRSGAPVIAGDNSSQPEVVGEGGLLVDAGNPRDVSAKLERVLTEPGLAETLRAGAVGQAEKFNWGRTASRAVEALEALPPRRPAAWRRVDRGHSRKPRIAFFSPLPPCKSGVSDYSVALLRELRTYYEIDLYHDSGYVPDLGLSDAFPCREFRTFARYSSELDYHSVVYQMGNSRFHHYMYDVLLRIPGVVTLHDFCMAGFHLGYGSRHGRERDYIRRSLLESYPDDAATIGERVEAWATNWVREAIQEDCGRRGWYLNRRVFASENQVIVHSPWCLGRVSEAGLDPVDRVSVIPLGATSRSPSEAERGGIRDRFGIPREAVVVASFGFIHPDKMSGEALEAFADVTRSGDGALFVFVGQEADGGAIQRRAEALGLNDRVLFLGHRPLGDFKDLAAVTDVGVNLRRPPTNGETSAALLDLLSSGVATLVTDVATFSDYPDHVVGKVQWDADGPGRLRRALRQLIESRRSREAMGRAAREHVREHHDWPRVTERYVEVIERGRADRLASRGMAPHGKVVGARTSAHEWADVR